MRGAPILDFALHNLTLGRAHFSLALAARSLPSLRDSGGQEEEEIGRAAEYLDRAVELLRQAAREDHLPRGLLARAALRRVRSDTKAALADLDETEEIAQRGRMRLHECDVHLERARLEIVLGRPAEARARLERARRLVEETGYRRRDGDVRELEAIVRALEDEKQEETMSEDALLWREKLDFLRQEEAITSDSATKFSLRKRIEEAEAKIRELGGDVPTVPSSTASPVDEEAKHAAALVEIKRKRLRVLERQAAFYGVNAPPEVVMEIDELKAEIKALLGGK